MTAAIKPIIGGRVAHIIVCRNIGPLPHIINKDLQPGMRGNKKLPAIG
jgi:hypothetical protein